ncbi:hypothetical protein NDN08_006432 [Rhodosorus marinus]|uniref:Reverse transcriptase Ty1/copia-type domain-containing protein n=1 Tax=Rhodosorus marinus TaxID=101924 RepID=A0AAV8UPK4_9RHOD|nr:hypothetical protein NDN08_006432 [Rhodosorus marinus]
MYPFSCLAIVNVPKEDAAIRRDKLDVPTVRGIILRCERSGRHLTQLVDGCKRWTKDIVVQEETFPLRHRPSSPTPETEEAIQYAKSREYLNPKTTDPDPSSDDDLEVPVEQTKVNEVSTLPRQIRSGATDNHKLSCLTTIPEPDTIEEALAGPHAKYCEEAIADELESLSKFQTWTLVERPKDKQVLGSKFVFKLKRNQDGEPARLVARGFQQTDLQMCTPRRSVLTASE